MNEVKVKIKREQIQAVVDGVVYCTSGKMVGPGRFKMWDDTFPDEITLSLPSDQIEKEGCPKAHEFAEVYNRLTFKTETICIHCGEIAFHLGRQKRKRYRMKVIEQVRISPAESWDIIELQEVGS